VRGSGSGRRKGDVETDEYLIEVKTSGKGVRVTAEMWRKIKQEALQEGKQPLLSLVLGDEVLFIMDGWTFGMLDSLAAIAKQLLKEAMTSAPRKGQGVPSDERAAGRCDRDV